MRRLFVPRASTGVAVVAAIVAVLAVMFPGLGFGQTLTSHGGTPSDVYTSTDPGVCHGDKVGADPVGLLPTAVQVNQESNLVVYFTSTWSAPSGSPTELLLTLQVEGGEFFETSPEWIANTGTGGSERAAHGVGTVMWSFPHVAAGAYTVEATAHIAAFPGTSGQSGANLQACALTVFVTPASPTASIPIGAGHVELNETFTFAGGFELGAFVPTGSDSNKCLVTLSESDFAISGTTVYCGVRQVDGQLGIFIHVLLPVPAPEHLVMSLTVYQEFARGYGQPVPLRG